MNIMCFRDYRCEFCVFQKTCVGVRNYVHSLCKPQIPDLTNYIIDYLPACEFTGQDLQRNCCSLPREFPDKRSLENELDVSRVYDRCRCIHLREKKKKKFRNQRLRCINHRLIDRPQDDLSEDFTYVPKMLRVVCRSTIAIININNENNNLFWLLI